MSDFLMPDFSCAAGEKTEVSKNFGFLYSESLVADLLMPARMRWPDGSGVCDDNVCACIHQLPAN
jgi:hypothetical protein